MFCRAGEEPNIEETEKSDSVVKWLPVLPDAGELSAESYTELIRCAAVPPIDFALAVVVVVNVFPAMIEFTTTGAVSAEYTAAPLAEIQLAFLTFTFNSLFATVELVMTRLLSSPVL